MEKRKWRGEIVTFCHFVLLEYRKYLIYVKKNNNKVKTNALFLALT